MDEQPPLDSSPSLRIARNFALAAVGMLTLGSCGGMLLGHYTVTGMTPFGQASEPSYISVVP